MPGDFQIHRQFYDLFVLQKDISQNNKSIIQISSAREQILSGVLILDKIYGKLKTGNNERNLYKCIPHDRHLPEFLVPYSIKTQFN